MQAFFEYLFINFLYKLAFLYFYKNEIYKYKCIYIFKKSKKPSKRIHNHNPFHIKPPKSPHPPHKLFHKVSSAKNFPRHIICFSAAATLKTFWKRALLVFILSHPLAHFQQSVPFFLQKAIDIQKAGSYNVLSTKKYKKRKTNGKTN